MIKCVCDNPLCYKNCQNIDELINKRDIAHKVTEMLNKNPKRLPRHGDDPYNKIWKVRFTESP